MADKTTTTWFIPLERPPYVAERNGPDGPPDNLNVLEISSRSRDPLGRSLSAMFLKEPVSGKPVEAVYQAAKCYGDGGPERVLNDGFVSKTRDRDRARTGPLRGFQHDGTFWPLQTGTQFYDRLWMMSARAAGVGQTDHDAFTDMFHRRGRSMACQARTMAMMQGMIRSRSLDVLDDPVAFSKAVEGDEQGITGPDARDEVRVVVTGSPRYTDQDQIYQKLDEIRERIGNHGMRVIHGEGNGLDRIVQSWARETGVPATVVPPDWDTHPRNAGYVQNEEMLDLNDPHLVVSFPDNGGKGPRHLVQLAQDRNLLVECVVEDGIESWTETENGLLANLDELAENLGRTQLCARISGPGALACAGLRNGEPRTDGEVRVVVAPGPPNEDERAVRAKLDSIHERSQPAALRIAIQETALTTSLSGQARQWAADRGIHCDMYLKQASGDAPGEHFERMLNEQQPHMVLTGRTTSPGCLASTEGAGIPIEMVTASGWTRTSDGTLPDLAKRRFDGHASPTPAVVKPYPGQSAQQAQSRLLESAREAGWAKGPLPERTSVNLRRDPPAGTVRVDRRTKWGNPFPLRKGASQEEREASIESYRDYLASRIDNGQIDIGELAALAGKPKGCHCAPEACHGDVLEAAAQWTAERELAREERERPPQPRGEAPDPLVEGPYEEETLEVDEIPPWDGSQDLEPEQAAAQQVWEPGVSDIEPLNRRRHALVAKGATADELTAYDDAAWDFEQALLDEPDAERARTSRPPDPGLERARQHLAEMETAGASPKQLERMQESIQEVDTRLEREWRTRQAREGSRGRDMARMLERMSGEGGPLAVADRIERAIEERTPAKPRPRQGAVRPVAAPPAPADEPTREVRVLVCGSPSLEDGNVLRAKLDSVRERIQGAPMRVVTGDANGTDQHALRWAKDASVPADVYEADWDGEGKSAGYRRNERMLSECDPHLLVAFPRNEDSPMTEHVIMGCVEREVPIETVDVRGVTHTSTPEPVDLKAIGRRTDDRPKIDGESIEDLDPVEYAARMSTTRAAGTMQEDGTIVPIAADDGREPAGESKSPAAATTHQNGTGGAVGSADAPAPATSPAPAGETESRPTDTAALPR